MKKWIIRIISSVIVTGLAASLWLCFCHTQKSLDNIPSKELMLIYLEESGEEYALEKIKGYSRNALIEIWGEPVFSLFGMFGDIWETNDGALIVYYDSDSNATSVKTADK